MKFYDIHVNDGVNSYSCFISVKDGLLTPNANKDDIASHAANTSKLDIDDLAYVDNVTEISEEEFNKATA